jgi:peroxiredoxin
VAEAHPAQPFDPTVPPAARSLDPARPRPGAATIALGLALALAIVAGAWYLGGRQGVDQLGRGGQNARLLPRIGDPAPELIALGADGVPVFLSQFRGQPVWLNFWGSWCPPCRSEMPEMQAAYERLQPQGLVLLAVSLDEPVAEAVRYAELNGATYLVAGDPFRRGSAAYAINNFPTHLLIDRDGVVRDVVLAELNEEQFVERAQAILAPAADA